MIALGTGSIFCSFSGCIPLTASFARSSVLCASGGRTQLASFFNGSFMQIQFAMVRHLTENLNWHNFCDVGGAVLLALAFLMPVFYFIPKTVLGAVIVTAVFPMIEYHEILPMWKGRSKHLNTHFCTLHFWHLNSRLIDYNFVKKELNWSLLWPPIYVVCWSIWNTAFSLALKYICYYWRMKLASLNP